MTISTPIIHALSQAVTDKLLSSKSGHEVKSVDLLASTLGFSPSQQVVGKLERSEVTKVIEEVLTEWIGQRNQQ